MKITLLGTRTVEVTYTLEIDDKLFSQEELNELNDKSMSLYDVQDWVDRNFDSIKCVVETDKDNSIDEMYDYEVEGETNESRN